MVTNSFQRRRTLLIKTQVLNLGYFILYIERYRVTICSISVAKDNNKIIIIKSTITSETNSNSYTSTYIAIPNTSKDMSTLLKKKTKNTYCFSIMKILFNFFNSNCCSSLRTSKILLKEKSAKVSSPLLLRIIFWILVYTSYSRKMYEGKDMKYFQGAISKFPCKHL